MKGFTFCRHSELTAPLDCRHPELVSGSSHQISESSKKGFTLIELLVVVLIIGILASVALPQYQKAVLKSRTAEAWTTLKALNTAGAAYCLENPSAKVFDYEFWDALDIEVNRNSKFWSYYGMLDCSSSTPATFRADHYGSPASFSLWLNPTTGRRSCSWGNCELLGFTKASSDSSICTCGSSCGASSCYYAD